MEEDIRIYFKCQIMPPLYACMLIYLTQLWERLLGGIEYNDIKKLHPVSGIVFLKPALILDYVRVQRCAKQ